MRREAESAPTPSLGSWRMLRASAAGFANVGVFVAFQALSLPIFLANYSSDRYAAWIILFGVPALLTPANLGVAAAASAEINMLRAAGRHEESVLVFIGVRRLLRMWLSGLTIMLVIGSLVASPTQLLHLIGARDGEARPALALLVVWWGVQMYWGVYSAGYEATLQAARNLFLLAAVRALEYATIIICASFAMSFVAIATALLLCRLVATAAISLDFRRHTDFRSRSYARQARVASLRPLVGASVAGSMLPLANSLQNQGILIVAGWELGPASVIALNAVRTITNAIYQFNTVVKAGVTPELSNTLGVGDLRAARSIAVRTSLVVVAGNILFTLIAMGVGRELLASWSSGAIVVSELTMTLFVLSATTDSMWSSMDNIAVAVNRNLGISTVLLISAGLSVVAAIPLSRIFSLNGVAVSLFVSSILVSLKTLPTSSRCLGLDVAAYGAAVVKAAQEYGLASRRWVISHVLR